MAVFNDNALIDDQLVAALDAASLARSAFGDLAALLSAIGELSGEDSLPRRLANIGQALADDYANLVDYQCGELEKLRAEKRAA
jgi:hypothetical protein